MNIVEYLMFGVVVAMVSVVMTRVLLACLKPNDIPNERSSHTVTTPRGGGLAIVTGFLLGLGLILILGASTPLPHFPSIGALLSLAMIVVLSLYDDFHAVSFQLKLGWHGVAITLAMLSGIVIDTVNLPAVGELDCGIWAYPLTMIWVLGLTNAYNFIDGLDGLAASTAVIAAAFFAYITFHEGSHFIYLASLALSAAAAGFLVFNWSPAKIFMGDVGSTFLGFTFAVIAIIAARYDHSHTSFFVIPLLLFHFIFDAFYTFCRRLLARENVFLPHRTHIYQLLNRTGYSHRQVSLIYAGLAVLQGIAAIWMSGHPGEERIYVFLPFLLAYYAIARIVVARARRQQCIT